MSRRDNVVSTYLSDEEKADLSRLSEKADESQSTLVREALLEYLDHDRAARLEGEVRDISDKLDKALTLLEDTEHTHTQGGGGQQSVPEKAREIVRRVHRNHDTPVREADIEIAIEDIAGGDDRTIEKYKGQFKKRGLLYEHPFQPVWTDSQREFVSWVEGATVSDVHDAIEEYSMTTDEFHEIAERERTTTAQSS